LKLNAGCDDASHFSLGLNPSLFENDIFGAGLPAIRVRGDHLEELLQFMFGASGRINRAKYWRSMLSISAQE
jgi:hypothetical protein